ncbi:DUF4238 domain-containing protein [Parvibaculaceae bacterium PLY_AMNH_Bact1]|nr:DUF4238 domain-containing protein [Parvibaculaceae bacterium PLY_AMNH_Bact1]
MSNPHKHHYLPVFYLSRWAGEDGMVCRFSRPQGPAVKTKRIVPKGTAYEPGLYSINGLPKDQAPVMERDFMVPLDSRAAAALKLLDNELPDSQWPANRRSDWTRFVWSLPLRNPREIQQLKTNVKEAWAETTPGLQEHYDALRTPTDPLTVDEYLAQLDPQHEDRFALQIARRLMDHSGIGGLINNMHWSVLRFDGCGIRLLTSDHPVRMPAAFDQAASFLTMPISPTQLFVAAREYPVLEELKGRKRRQHAKDVNKLTVMHATDFVYGVDDHMLTFVQKHMATRRHSTAFERLAVLRNHTILDKSSPAAKQ